MSKVSYPHPVLGNTDDVIKGTVEPSLTFRAADEVVELAVANLVTTNSTLDDMVTAGDAAWSIRVQCARTYFRKEVVIVETERKIVFDGRDLDGRVDVDVSLFATKAVAGYLPVGAHADYGSAKFDLEPGALLALGPAYSFDIDKQFDPLKAPVASLVRISKGDFADGAFRLALEDERIEIILSDEDWQLFSGVKDRVPGVLHVALVLPALAEAVRRLNEFAGRRWADRLRAIVETRDVDCSDPLRAAQVLLQGPLTRAFNELNAALDREI
jgi:hypothetical protein